MVKVLDDGVPLAAVVSVEISPRAFLRRCQLDALESWRVNAMRNPALMYLSVEDVAKLRELWLKEWPGVAAYFKRR